MTTAAGANQLCSQWAPTITAIEWLLEPGDAQATVMIHEMQPC